MNRRNVQKINIFWFNCPFSGGVTKLEAFHWCFVTKLNTPKPSPFCGKLKIFSDFLLHFRAFRHFFEKFNTFWFQMGYLYILEPIREPPSYI